MVRPRHYARGANFERQVRDELRERGAWVIRAAGSKGKVDLVAFFPGDTGEGRPPLVWAVQCKIDGRISPAERDALLWMGAEFPWVLAFVASRRRGGGVEFSSVDE